MKLNLVFFAVALSVSTSAWCIEEGMPKMLRIQPKRVYSVKTPQEGEELLEQRGYGDKEPMVRMMNLMMVDGSGYEGMEMGEMSAEGKKYSVPISTASHPGHVHQASTPAPTPADEQAATYDFDLKISPDPPRVGTHTLVVGIQRKNDQKPAKSLQVKAQVFMTSMDMGIEEPKVRELAPGRYQMKVAFSMKGAWAVKLLLPEGGEKVLHFEVGSFR